MTSIGRQQISPRAFIALMFAVTVLAILAVCTLPHSRFIQFTSSHEPEVRKMGWIYERIHFDATPIDVVFIGSSHTVYDVDSEEVERNLTDGPARNWHVVNFGLIHPGRDMDYLLVRETLENTHPRLLVIEAQYDEFRAMHVAFQRVADTSDILFAPIIINNSYFSNLVRLPSRQVSLFLQTLAPSLFGDVPDFSHSHYQGPHWQGTLAELGTQTPRNTILSAAELERQRREFSQLVQSKIRLPDELRPLEYRASLAYLEKIVRLAQENEVPIRILYLPGWHQPGSPQFAPLYRSYAPLWNPIDVFKPTNIWQDANHMNRYGSLALSAWLGQKISEEYPDFAGFSAQRHR